MRKRALSKVEKDPNIDYRGENPSRLDNLTDAVFGIAVTLLIFNLSNPNSLKDLVVFTKTLPAFLVSIGFLIIIWKEHVRFSEIYGLRGPMFVFLNSLFIALIIFYVYPLRFLTLFMTQAIFGSDLPVTISPREIPDIMIYYGFVAFALYFILLWFYQVALKKKSVLQLNEYEIMHTTFQRNRMILMSVVPIVSILLVIAIKGYSVALASFIGGMMYSTYTPAIIIWAKRYKKKAKEIIDSNPKFVDFRD